ncbi:hypothetical protein DPMN_105419 [Dreissena polymorpha]|uniref:Uncharacterized protein n=1 Tax=Dreissena polymorpha TaxID=45954 RepID=A0A9D4HGS2_DREPO|nr:hypothetical protein DPMN_105419 [Dreissena polymorpha]
MGHMSYLACKTAAQPVQSHRLVGKVSWSHKRTDKPLTRQHKCADCSLATLTAYGIRRIFG